MGIATNKLALSGIVYKTPIRKVSPSGIPHCQFMLDHRSQQQEAGYKRHAWCRMPVIISGESAKQQVTADLTAGSRIQVQGFISSYQNASGLSKLVLHAEQIELTYSGD